MSYQRNCPNWISFWVNPRQSKPRNAAVKSRKRWKTLAVWGAKAAELQHLALMALMAAGAVAVSSTISSGWAWAASDQPLWHPKMASLVNPYWAFMALALLTEKKKTQTCSEPIPFQSFQPAHQISQGVPYFNPSSTAPRAALVPPCGNGNEPCWPWANRVDKAQHLVQPHRISTADENMSPRLEISMSISFKMENYV